MTLAYQTDIDRLARELYPRGHDLKVLDARLADPFASAEDRFKGAQYVLRKNLKELNGEKQGRQVLRVVFGLDYVEATVTEGSSLLGLVMFQQRVELGWMALRDGRIFLDDLDITDEPLSATDLALRFSEAIKRGLKI